MPRLIFALLACLWTASVFAANGQPSTHANAVPARSAVPDSKQIESDLQHLSWRQFRSVVESVPPLKTSVEAYGPIGWKFVEANYAHYPWKRTIDKLDETQKRRLVDLIQTAKRSR
jgi:hypothetical protein